MNYIQRPSPRRQFDAQRAMSDFDQDTIAIVEVLKEFRRDVDARLRDLESTSISNLARYISIVHEIANTLGTAWCIDACRGVRAIEDHIRAGLVDDPVQINESIRLWVFAALKDVERILSEYSDGMNPFNELDYP